RLHQVELVLLDGDVEPTGIEVAEDLGGGGEIPEPVAISISPGIRKDLADGLSFGKGRVAPLLLLIHLGGEIGGEYLVYLRRLARQPGRNEGIRKVVWRETGMSIDQGLFGSGRTRRHNLHQPLLDVLAAGLGFDGRE